MCNLNIIVKTKNAIKDNAELQNLMAFLTTVTSVSYLNNSDGDGIYVNGVIIKSTNKLNLLEFYRECKQGCIILTHQRFATSGKIAEMTQPFEDSDFVLAHNGIINDFLGKEGSDTFGFFNQFVEKFNKLETGTRDEKIINTIKSMLDNLNSGSYSIALVDKLTNSLYYFKDSRTSIYFSKSANYLFITTAYNNSNYLNIINEKFKSMKVKDYRIYKITADDNIKITNIGKIKQVQISKPVWEIGKAWSGDYCYNNDDDEDKIVESDIYTSGNALPCDICTTPTHNRFVKNSAIFCDKCIEEFKGNDILSKKYGGYIV